MGSCESTPDGRVRSAPAEDVDGVFACVRKDRLMSGAGTRISRWSCAIAPARCRRARSATRTCWRAASSAATSCACAGRVERFRDELQIDVRAIARADAAQVDPAAFLPSAYRDLDELDGFLEHLAREVYDTG